VSFLHQDDEWMPGRAAAVFGWLARHPPRSFLIHAVRFIDHRNRELGPWTCPLRPRVPLQPKEVARALLVQNFICIAGTVFPRQLAVDAGGLDETLWYTADWDLWLRLLGMVEVVEYLDTPLARFRVHASAITATWSAHLGEFRAQLEGVLDRHLPRSAGGGADRPTVEAAARFSVEVNVALAALAHRKPIQVERLGRALLRLGPQDWRTYLRDSRLVERVGARLRARTLAGFVDRWRPR
jgi:hypothetical protein